jgi:hypothetical protein
MDVLFHGTGNSAQLWQNLGIARGGGGVQTPLGTSLFSVIFSGSSIYLYCYLEIRQSIFFKTAESYCLRS